MNGTSLLPTEQDIAFFAENGYWVSPKLLTDERLELLGERMERVYNGEYETGRAPWRGYWTPADGDGLRKTDNSHWSDSAIRGLATDSVIGEIAALLMGADCIRLWHDQLLYKPGRAGGKEKKANVGWHQDYSYWQSAAEPSLLTAWVAFDDVDLTNGCMQMVPRSHKWGLRRVNDFFEQDMQKQEAEMDLPEGEKFQTVPIVMKAGQVSFHHALTFHGSGPNTTDRPRRSLAVHLMTGTTRYRKGEKRHGHMNVELLQPQDGDLFEGEYFPVLFQK